MSNRPITWTNEEIEEACHWMNLSILWRPGLRDALGRLGAIHPAEAREMQREVWDGCLKYLGRMGDREATDMREVRYPSLLPKSPPPLILSTGTWEKKGAAFNDEWRCVHGRQAGTCTGSVGAYVLTASDARALADWLDQYGSDDERP